VWSGVDPTYDIYDNPSIFSRHSHSQIFFFIFKPVRNQCIPGYTKEEIAKRVQIVDRSNAKRVLQSKARADVVVQSIAATTNE
jgi:hypothetical protein